MVYRCVLLSLLFTGFACAADELVKPDVSILLVSEPAVIKELALSERQQEAANRAVAELDETVFKLRDDNSRAAVRKLTLALQKAERRLSSALSDKQYRRLMSIVYRVQGYRALFETPTARRLELTEEQQKDIRKVLRDTGREIAELQSAAGDKPDPMIDQAVRLKEQDGEERVNALLTEEQRKQWAMLRGAPFDVSQLPPAAPHAPELTGLTGWLNSEPLTLAGLRGKVVVVHFWTFGDKNCVANYPWYRDWYSTYADRGLVEIGIHTAEFADQQDADAIAAQAQLNKLEFPIAIDNAAATWNAWSNPAWPAIYLLDRRGCVRRWWYGPLNRPDANGAQMLQNDIESLLGETQEAHPSEQGAQTP